MAGKAAKTATQKKPGVTYINLDEVKDEEVIIVLGNVEYPLKHVSVEDFIENTKMIQALGAGDTIEGDFETTLKIIGRAFPSMGSDIIRSMTMTQMNKLVEYAHKMNGQKAAQDKAAEVADQNPKSAG